MNIFGKTDPDFHLVPTLLRGNEKWIDDMMKRYPTYKDSGVEWIGEILEYWGVKPLKHAVRINQDSLPEHTDENYEIQYIDIGNTDEDGLLNPPKVMTFGISPSRARRVVRKGDTIVSTVRTYLKAIAYIDSEDENLIASTGFAVLTPTDQIQSKYLYYLVCGMRFVTHIGGNRRRGKGLVRLEEILIKDNEQTTPYKKIIEKDVRR